MICPSIFVIGWGLHAGPPSSTAILEALTVAETEKLGINPPSTSVILPIDGDCSISRSSRSNGSLDVRKFTLATATEKAVVNILVDLPPDDYEITGIPKYKPSQQDFREGDLIPIIEYIPSVPPRLYLRVHRIVAPDPDKHIPGWVELRFEPKDKTSPDKPTKEKPAGEKPAYNQPEAKPQKP